MVECPGRNPCWSKAGRKCVLTVVSMRASKTFAAGQSSEIDRYEVPREEFLSGLGIGDFQSAGIRHDVTESLKSADIDTVRSMERTNGLHPGISRWETQTDEPRAMANNNIPM